MEERGYSVLGEATDGFDAIEMCKKIKPDLVLMDIKMPLLDGLSAARILQQEQIGATIVLLTAYSEREFIDSAKEIGVSGYLVKPIDEKSIIPCIELAVARSREMQKLQKDIAKEKNVWKAAASLRKPRARSWSATACASRKLTISSENSA